MSISASILAPGSDPMFKFARRSFTLLLLAAFVAVPGVASAQKLPPTVVGIIDSQRISRDAKAFQSARAQLDQFRQQFQGEVSKEEERLRAEEQELGRQRAILTPDAFEARRRDFEKKVQEAQRKVQERSRALEQSFNNARNEIGQVVLKVINDIAVQRGITVVLDRAQVQFASDQNDITADTIKMLDQRLTSVKVPPPVVQP